MVNIVGRQTAVSWYICFHLHAHGPCSVLLAMSNHRWIQCKIMSHDSSRWYNQGPLHQIQSVSQRHAAPCKTYVAVAGGPCCHNMRKPCHGHPCDKAPAMSTDQRPSCPCGVMQLSTCYPFIGFSCMIRAPVLTMPSPIFSSCLDLGSSCVGSAAAGAAAVRYPDGSR